MDSKTLHVLEYPKVLERLAAHCDFSASMRLARELDLEFLLVACGQGEGVPYHPPSEGLMDIWSREKRSAVMAAVRPKGNRSTELALAKAVTWSVRYLPNKALPDKAVQILDLAGARARRRGALRVEPSNVAEVVSELAGVPEERLLETDAERLLRLEALLGERIVGHKLALERIATVLRRNASGARRLVTQGMPGRQGQILAPAILLPASRPFEGNRRPLLDGEGICAQAAQLALDVLLETAHSGHHQDDAEHADGHPHEGERGAQLVRRERGHRHEETLDHLGTEECEQRRAWARRAHSARSASTGFIRAARQAGRKPAMTPVATDTSNAMPTKAAESVAGMKRSITSVTG